MKGLNFPVFRTKIEGITETFNLNVPEDRKRYYEKKAGREIAKLKEYLKNSTFVAFLIGKKNSGKGTYSKLFMEVFGSEHVGHVSVGDIVRDAHKAYESGEGKKELTAFLEKNYRGFHDLSELENIILGRSTTTLVPSELIVALLKYEISKRTRQAIFIDGFPRALDQIGYSLFLKDLIGYRDDPDFLIFIDVAEMVVDERIKYRRICPKCQTPRNMKLAPTKDVGYNEETNFFYLICDNPECERLEMICKEGDEFGIEPIRERLEIDDKILRQLLGLTGIPKIYLRNSVPVEDARDYIDEYEATPVYEYEYDKSSKKVRIIEKPWVIKDDDGVESCSLLPATVAISLIKQVASLL